VELSCDADMVHLGIVVRIFNFQKLASLQCYVGSVRAAVEPKQVMFSDGIRPGGDLTELDGVDAVQSSAQSTGRRSKKQDKSGSTQLLCQRDYVIRSVCLSVCVCLLAGILEKLWTNLDEISECIDFQSRKTRVESIKGCR